MPSSLYDPSSPGTVVSVLSPWVALTVAPGTGTPLARTTPLCAWSSPRLATKKTANVIRSGVMTLPVVMAITLIVFPASEVPGNQCRSAINYSPAHCPINHRPAAELYPYVIANYRKRKLVRKSGKSMFIAEGAARASLLLAPDGSDIRLRPLYFRINDPP